MPVITPPRLDDRDAAALRRELVRRIPMHSERWTDHNASDPGIALLEVFAWLVENLLRRMDRVPEAARLEFLRLLGIAPRTAAVAQALVRIDLPKNVLAPRTLSLSPVAPRAQLGAGKLRFQAVNELQVLPVVAWPAVKRRDPDYEPDSELERRVYSTLDVSRGGEGYADPDTLPFTLEPYQTEPLTAPAHGTLPRAIFLDDTLDKALWIALLTPDGFDLGKSDDEARAARRRLADRLAGTVLSIGVWVDETLREPMYTAPRPGSAVPEVDLRVELPKPPFDDPILPIDQVAYSRASVVSDTTGGFERTGVLRVQLPARGELIDTWRLTDRFGRSCEGMGALPPAIDDDVLARRVVTWVRIERPGVPAPKVRWVDVNTVGIEQAVTAPPELLGVGTGGAGQTVKTSRAPVLRDSLVVEVREADNQWVRWYEVPDLGLSRANEPHYTIEPSTGTLTFGDGRHGRMPQVGEVIRARTYRWGGGAAGNVPAGAITKILEPADASNLKVTQLLPARGGQDGETVELASARIPEVLRHNDRAVAIADFQDLARETPGAGVGRVEVLPRHHPAHHIDEVPGVVTLVILPLHDPEHPDEPVPDRAMLRAVCQWLEPRRLCTTELYLIPPTYVRLHASVAIELRDGYGLQTVKRWVELAIRQYFAPLPPYGPAGDGWPMGRDVRASDVEAAALAVEGVRVVTDVVLGGEAVVKNPGDPCDRGHVLIRRWELPSIVEVSVAQGEVADTPQGQPPRDKPTTGYGVPVVKEVC